MNLDSKIPDTSPPVNSVNDSRFSYGGDITMNIYPQENGYEISDGAQGLYAYAKNISSNGRGIAAELDIFYPYPEPLKKGIILHLQNHQERQKLAYELAGACQVALPWDKILDQICEKND